MADSTDLPATGSETASSPPESVPSQVTVTTFAGVVVSSTTSSEAGPPEPQPYQPLSMLAVAAFGLAAVYTAVVGIVGLIAMLNHTPLPLPISTLLLPVLAAVLALIARFQIRRSEGTQSGLKLASWAVGLSVGVGIVYCMYYLGTFLAVRSQAQTFADRWLQKITEGKIDEAFHDTTKPPRKIVGTLRQSLELQFNNAPDPGLRGPFSNFGATEYVRLLQLDPKAKIEAAGVRDWEYEQGGFTVTLMYRVTTDLAAFPLQVKVHGAESSAGAYAGRQWNVVLEETVISSDSPNVPGSATYTEAGKNLRKQASVGAALANAWVESLSRAGFDAVFALTLDQKDRSQYPQYLQRFALGSVLAADADALKFLQARQKLLAGDLIRMEEGVFWTPPGLRPTVEAEAKALFDPTKFKQRRLSIQPTGLPIVKSDEKRLRFGYDVSIVAPQDDATQPPIVLEGRVFVGADRAELREDRPTPEAWRVEALELIRGRNAPVKSGPGAPGGPPKGG